MSDPTDAEAHDALDELLQPPAPSGEIERLTKELERAYRCICGFHTAMRKGEILGRTAFTYHSPTIGAARRFVNEGDLAGSDYFDGKPIEVLHQALTR